jgi:hypothetical protein
MTAIDPALLTNSGIDAELIAAIAQATEANILNGRTGKWKLDGTVKIDKESGKRVVKARVSVGLPQNDDDSLTKKYPSVVLMTIDNDHPGQQRIDA